uniref:Thioredoxin domain-containing protein n=1 Tax=Strigamia maritima TaxID=126957 RepID=T1J1H2_STRMM
MARVVTLLPLILIAFLLPFRSVGRRSADDEAVIEEVDGKGLKALVEEESYLAVFFCKYTISLHSTDHDGRLCGEECEQIMHELEKIDDDTDKFGVAFVKCQDRKLAKSYGVNRFPALVYFRNKEPAIYDGELKDEDKVLAWLTDLDSMDNPDAIEEVNSIILHKVIDDSDFVAVFFYKENCKKCEKVLKELENIDDDADKLGIAFVKIRDQAINEEYGFDDLPTLVYYRKEIPLVYDGDLTDEEEVLAWLVANKNLGDDDDIIEDVTARSLTQLIESVDHLAVLFYDNDEDETEAILKELENIDDDSDKHGIHMVKIDDDQVAHEYGIDELPTLVYFEKQIPSVYDGDLTDERQVLNWEEEVLQWLIHQVESDEIEDVSDKMLQLLVEKEKHLAVLFYDKDDKKSEKVLMELENIDDDCDKHGITFVKVDDDSVAKAYGIEDIPILIYFEDEIPNIYDGDLMNEEKVLTWLIHQVHTDEIEDVNDDMLRMLIKKTPHLVALFYDKDDKTSAIVLEELEEIDDDADKYDISIVKIDHDEMAKDFGFETIPALVYFEHGIPNVYEGDLTVEEDVLEWLIHQKSEDTIEEVTDEMVEDLIREHEYVVVFFTGQSCRDCDIVLEELEKIDDDTDDHGIHFLTTEETDLAKKFGIKTFPSLVLFRNGEPVLYKGDLKDEEKVLAWLTHEETLEIPDQIEEVNAKMLDKILDNSDHVAVFFYNENCKKCDKMLVELEHIDDEADEYDIDFVKISDPGIAKEYGLKSLPALLFFRKKFPQIYEGSLEDEDKVLDWLIAAKNMPHDVIEVVDRNTMEVLMDDVDHLAVFFFKDNCKKCEATLQELENIDDETDEQGIHFVKTNDVQLAQELGINEFPSLVYFEEKVPSIYEGDLSKEESVLEWLIHQKMEDTIENINRDMLNTLIEERDYVSVYFYKEKDADCEYVLKILELIDDDCSDYGVELLKMNDPLMAKKYGIRNLPGLVLFRHGKPIIYKGDLEDEDDILEWLTNPDNLELEDQIERVNRKMFEKIRKRTDYLAAYFYSDENCKQCSKVLAEIENIDDEAHAEGIHFVKVDDEQLAKDYGVFALPAVVFFKNRASEPVIYAGDLKNEERILDWLLANKDPSTDYIEEVDGKAVKDIVKKSEHVIVFFYNKEDCENCGKVLEELENIDDDTDRHGILFVKTQDLSLANAYGVHDFPALIYFEKHVPNIYEGDLLAEEDVLQWLITQKTEDTIETVNRDLLERMIEDTQYLAVFFYKPNCKACDQTLEELENIDDDLDLFGINMVKIQDTILAKRYGIKTVPAVVYFRNGNPLVYEGDLKNEELLLEWLIDDDNRELADEIEAVNNRMLEKLLEDSSFLAVFFYDEGECPECSAVLAELENIDDEADTFGIDFVKINDPMAAERFNILTTPALVYFRKKIPIIYEGDLLDEERILTWLTSQDVFEIKDEIEEVNRKMLDKLLDENDFVAVFFYDYDCPKCEEVLEELEHIDDEADNLDITFVKIKDPRFAKKYGINQLPALVYFRRKFPSIYRVMYVFSGDLLAEDEVLEWLQKNRYRHPELNLFMYALAAITLAFVLYTIFLMFCFKGHQKTA